MTTIKTKNSQTSAAVPASLEQGELAINERDGILYYRFSDANGGPATPRALIWSGGTFTGDVTFNATVNAADGSDAAPAIAWGTQGDTGVYYSSAQGLSVTVEGANAFTVNSARQIISSKLLVPAGGNVYLEEPAYADADGTSGVGFIAQQESVALICGNRPAFKARVDGSKVVCETAGVLALNPANTNPLPQEATICAIWVYQQIGLGSQTYSVLSSGNAPSAFKGDVLIGHDPARDHGILSHAKKPQTGYNLEVYGSFLQSKSSGNATFEGAASFASTLSVGGAATFSASATFSSQAEVSGSTSSFAPKCQVAESGVVEGNPSANVQLSFASGTFHKFSLTQSVTFAMPTATNSNLPLLGSSLTVVIYTANGGNNATFTDVDWPNGDTPTVTQAAGRMDVFTFFHDGIKWRGTVVQNFSQN